MADTYASFWPSATPCAGGESGNLPVVQPATLCGGGVPQHRRGLGLADDPDVSQLIVVAKDAAYAARYHGVVGPTLVSDLFAAIARIEARTATAAPVD